MGDYSRDTFELTNAMHQLLTDEPVTDARHYVGVRVQQGVPLLDADLNELDDIRNMELRAILRYFIGEGVPANNQGFQITAIVTDNDFIINPGLILVNGLPVINLAVTTYNTQSINDDLPALTTPGADRVDIVFLDVWHDEVSGTDFGNGDFRLVNPQIGLETARRISRRWQIRVLEGETDLSTLLQDEGHSYVALALLHRLSGASVILEPMIEDLRKNGITLAENLKVPINLRRGLEVLDIERYGQMLRGLRTSLFERLRSGLLPFQTLTPMDETLLMMALQEMMNQAHIGEVQAFGRNMDNRDALRFMNDLYDAQDGWLSTLSDLGNDGGVAQDFIDDYRDFLDGNPSELIKGLRPALDLDDLLAAVIAQEELNFWLTAPIGNLPEGSVDSLYLAAIPANEPLTAGSSYDFIYDIAVNFTSPEPAEDFNIQVTLPTSFGTATLPPDQNTLTFSPPEGQATITVTVVPSGSSPSAELDVAAIAVRNATLRSPQPPITLTLGDLPPAGAFFYYAGPRLNPAGQLEIPVNHLTRPQGRLVLFRLRNASTSENRTYEIVGQIIPDGLDPTGWTADPVAPIILAPDTTTDVTITVHGSTAVAGITGEITATATLTEIDGNPPPEPQTATVTIAFLVI